MFEKKNGELLHDHNHDGIGPARNRRAAHQ
jgi:hypothetical protein